MLLNSGGWGLEVAKAVQLREHGYLIERQDRPETERAGGPRKSHGRRSRAIVLRLVTAGVALLVRAGLGERA
jgi:hypothetical protein